MLLNSWNNFLLLCVFLNIPAKLCTAFQIEPRIHVHTRSALPEEGMDWESPILGCEVQQLRSLPGTYVFYSEGSPELCALYLLAPTDHVIQMEFTYFDVGCENNGAVALLDGWELDQEIFPSPDDHPLPLAMRYLPFCGDVQTPDAVYTSRQNVAQLQYSVPIPTQGFTLRVEFKKNHKPCNMVLLSNFAKVTLRNFGLQRNCTALSLYPQTVRFFYVNVGEQEKVDEGAGMSWIRTYGPRILKQECETAPGTNDAIQVTEGNGVAAQRTVMELCGYSRGSRAFSAQLGCKSCSVRLQSSGEFYNTVRFTFTSIADTDLDQQGYC